MICKRKVINRESIRTKHQVAIFSTGGPSSSCEMTILRNNAIIMAEIEEFVCEYLRPLYGIKASLMYVENLEMDNSLKWILFIKVSAQITSDIL